MDDAQLLHAYAHQGSEPAFRELVARHVDLVYSAALRQSAGDPHLAQELSQMVFIDLAKKARSLCQHPALVAWLHRSTALAAKSLRRSQARRQQHEHDFATEAEALSQESLNADWDKIRPVLDQSLNELSERDRQAVLLRFFSNQSFTELGAQLGIPENTARMRVNRALDKLQAGLQRRGIRSTASALALILGANSVAAAPAGLADTLSSAALVKTAAATGVGAIAEFFLMNKIQACILGSITLGLTCGLSWSLISEHDRAASLARLQTQNTALQDKLHASSNKNTKLSQQLSDLHAKEPPPLSDVMRERYALDLLVKKRELDFKYAELFRTLHLGHDRTDALKVLIVERDQAMYDAKQVAKLQDMELLPPSAQKRLNAAATAEVDTRIKNLIGQDNYEYFQFYDDAMFYRSFFTPQGDTALLPILLSKEQTATVDDKARRMMKLLATNFPNYADEAYFAGTFTPLPPGLSEKASDFLSAEEKSRFQYVETSFSLQQQMQEIARKAAAEGRLYLTKNSARDYGVARTPKSQKHLAPTSPSPKP